MSTSAVPLLELERELRAHLAVCEDVLAVVQREHQLLKTNRVSDLEEFFRTREGMLERVTSAQQKMLGHKAAWLRLDPAEREQHPGIGALIRQNLDLIMKIVLLDRENEKLLLANKLVPSSHLPAPERQNPSLVARRYRDHS